MRRHPEQHQTMNLPFDPVMMLQLVVAGLIVATLPDGSRNASTADVTLAASAATPEPFLHSDGNIYVEHAGMAIDFELFQLIAPRA